MGGQTIKEIREESETELVRILEPLRLEMHKKGPIEKIYVTRYLPPHMDWWVMPPLCVISVKFYKEIANLAAASEGKIFTGSTNIASLWGIPLYQSEYHGW